MTIWVWNILVLLLLALLLAGMVYVAIIGVIWLLDQIMRLGMWLYDKLAEDK